MSNADIKQHISIAERAKWNKVVADFDIHLGTGGIANHPIAEGNIPGFTTNDFTDADRVKLDGIQDGALNNPHPGTHPHTMITGLANIAKSGSWADLSNIPQFVQNVVNGTHNAATVGGIRLTIANTAPSNPQNNRELWFDTNQMVINVYVNNVWAKLGAVFR